jgi:hypothetical protein
MRLVFANLLYNAWKFSPRGGTLTPGLYSERSDAVVSVGYAAAPNTAPTVRVIARPQ